MQTRPATTCDLSDKSRICLLDLRDAPNCEFEAIRQHVRNMKPYMLTVQHNDDSPDDDSIRALCEEQANHGVYFLLNFSVVQSNRIRLGTSVWGFCTNLHGLTRSFADAGEDLHLHFDSAKRVAEAAVEAAIARFQRTGSARRWNGTFFTTWSTALIGNLAKVDRMRAERINQELQKNLCQTFQTEAEKRYYLLIWKKCTSRDIWNKRKTRTTRKTRQHGLSQNGKSGSSYDNTVTWDIRSQRSWLVPYGTQEQGEKLYVCPTCEARPLPLPHPPGMLPRCLRVNQRIGLDLVDMEVRDGTSAQALNVVCWGRAPKCSALVDKL